ncbi:hypothetical protein ACFXGC_36710 [Streptomyces olivaceus]
MRVQDSVATDSVRAARTTVADCQATMLSTESSQDSVTPSWET